jgi:hypothetical protein
MQDALAQRENLRVLDFGRTVVGAKHLMEAAQSAPAHNPNGAVVRRKRGAYG